jgi:hypothetical protein
MLFLYLLFLRPSTFSFSASPTDVYRHISLVDIIAFNYPFKTMVIISKYIPSFASRYTSLKPIGGVITEWQYWDLDLNLPHPVFDRLKIFTCQNARSTRNKFRCWNWPMKYAEDDRNYAIDRLVWFGVSRACTVYTLISQAYSNNASVAGLGWAGLVALAHPQINWLCHLSTQLRLKVSMSTLYRSHLPPNLVYTTGLY